MEYISSTKEGEDFVNVDVGRVCDGVTGVFWVKRISSVLGYWGAADYYVVKVYCRVVTE